MEDVFPNLEGYEDAMRRDLGVEIGEIADRHAAVKIWRIDTRDRGNWKAMARWMHRELEAYLEVIGRGPEE